MSETPKQGALSQVSDWKRHAELYHMFQSLKYCGCLYLMVIAVLPIVASMIWDLPTSLSLGGTSLLIVVGVALSTKEELEGLLSKRSYLGFIRD